MANLKHIQVPNSRGELSVYDALVYASIKRFQTSYNKYPKVSITQIRDASKLSREVISNSIEHLQVLGYITIINSSEGRGRTNKYQFSEYKKFEIFDYAFLDDENTTAKEKGYLILMQPFMYKDVIGKGKTTLTNDEISMYTGLSLYEIKKLHSSLKAKGYLTMMLSSAIDPISKVKKDIKVFDLEKLGQSIIWILRDHEAKLQLHEEFIAQQKEDNLQQEANIQEIFQRLRQVEAKTKYIDQLERDNKKKDEEIARLKTQASNFNF